MDANPGRWRAIELRIHGVSGTPADELLDCVPSVRVLGDGLAGFFRLRRDVEPPPGDVVKEAYTWGNLTSGRSSRALWLLLLPFMLANLAYWMRPRQLGGGYGAAHNAVNHVYDAVVRLLALSLTLLLALASAGVSMDIVAWQCASTAACGSEGWLHVVSTGWWASPGRRLALAAAVPVLVVGVLWRLSHRAWKDYETDRSADPVHREAEAPLSRPGFWRGRAIVGRLRTVHVSASLAAVAGLLALAPWRADDAAGAGAQAAVGWWLVLVAAVLAGLCTLLAMLESWPGSGRRWPGRLGAAYPFVRAASILTLVAAAGYACVPRPGWAAAGPLPGFSGLLAGLFLAQCVLLLALLVVTALLYTTGRQHRAAALRGLAGPLTAALGVLLGGAFSAAVAIRSAGWLGGCPIGPSTPEAGCVPFSLPGAYAWVLVGFTVEALTALLMVAGLWFAYRRLAVGMREPVVRQYGSDADPGRTDEIARGRALGRLTEALPVCLVALMLPALALVVVTFGTASGGRVDALLTQAVADEALYVPTLALGDMPEPLLGSVDAMVTLGTWLSGLLLIGLVFLGRTAYVNRPVRQAVGILWDVGTFWPRAAHPLSPPCYAERSVPQLVSRVSAAVREGVGVVLSGHSQGSVLAAATIWQLPEDCQGKVALLTYGSPLDRLYSRYFPAYFGPVAFEDLNARTATWTNLWRTTDPIGGQIHLPRGRTVPPGEPLPDPREYDPGPGDALYPPVEAHGRYTEDPDYRPALLAAATASADAVTGTPAPNVPAQRQGTPSPEGAG
ncbi:hypothetical protein [Allonocardiopsis opalescens]|uniref:Integral membrane protein n=1 Tax=Allonocardiopsis opalescens TaxID=1144618 RepID=A0A2T0QA21_9ACTN|nr:hypothetical protein [Allonocardiopsis opalescens]PRY00746.1 hypothetical protein CLV72_102378 [Allonocardiopsis opalescens]